MFDVYHAERIPDPGAKISRQVPMLENDERASVVVVEPVVMALAARAGEKLQAFAPLLLPAATAIVTFALCRLLTAVSSARGNSAAEAHVGHCGGDVILPDPIDAGDNARS